MRTVQAGAKAWLDVEFFDKNNDPVVPNSATYKVTNVTESTVVRASTSLSPASLIEIELDSTDTTMQDAASNEEELVKVCVTSTYGAGDSRDDVYRFKILPSSC